MACHAACMDWMREQAHLPSRKHEHMKAQPEGTVKHVLHVFHHLLVLDAVKLGDDDLQGWSEGVAKVLMVRDVFTETLTERRAGTVDTNKATCHSKI